MSQTSPNSESSACYSTLHCALHISTSGALPVRPTHAPELAPPLSVDTDTENAWLRWLRPSWYTAHGSILLQGHSGKSIALHCVADTAHWGPLPTPQQPQPGSDKLPAFIISSVPHLVLTVEMHTLPAGTLTTSSLLQSNPVGTHTSSTREVRGVFVKMSFSNNSNSSFCADQTGPPTKLLASCMGTQLPVSIAERNKYVGGMMTLFIELSGLPATLLPSNPGLVMLEVWSGTVMQQQVPLLLLDEQEHEMEFQLAGVAYSGGTRPSHKNNTLIAQLGLWMHYVSQMGYYNSTPSSNTNWDQSLEPSGCPHSSDQPSGTLSPSRDGRASSSSDSTSRTLPCSLRAASSSALPPPLEVSSSSTSPPPPGASSNSTLLPSLGTSPSKTLPLSLEASSSSTLSPPLGATTFSSLGTEREQGHDTVLGPHAGAGVSKDAVQGCDVVLTKDEEESVLSVAVPHGVASPESQQNNAFAQELKNSMRLMGVRLLSRSISRGWVKLAANVLDIMTGPLFQVPYADLCERKDGGYEINFLHEAVASAKIAMVAQVMHWGARYQHACSWVAGVGPVESSPLHLAIVVDRSGKFVSSVLRKFPKARGAWGTVKNKDGVTPAMMAACLGCNIDLSGLLMVGDGPARSITRRAATQVWEPTSNLKARTLQSRLSYPALASHTSGTPSFHTSKSVRRSTTQVWGQRPAEGERILQNRSAYLTSSSFSGHASPSSRAKSIRRSITQVRKPSDGETCLPIRLSYGGGTTRSFPLNARTFPFNAGQAGASPNHATKEHMDSLRSSKSTGQELEGVPRSAECSRVLKSAPGGTSFKASTSPKLQQQQHNSNSSIAATSLATAYQDVATACLGAESQHHPAVCHAGAASPESASGVVTATSLSMSRPEPGQLSANCGVGPQQCGPLGRTHSIDVKRLIVPGAPVSGHAVPGHRPASKEHTRGEKEHMSIAGVEEAARGEGHVDTAEGLGNELVPKLDVTHDSRSDGFMDPSLVSPADTARGKRRFLCFC